VINGYHATIFAFGQTGSGKTFTMEGNIENAPGITLNCISEMFGQLSKNKKENKQFRIYCSYLQIYNEKIFDLLNPAINVQDTNEFNNSGLRLRWTKEDQFQVENLFTYEIENPKQAIELYNFGCQNRITTSHKLNSVSSRSHSIFCITVEKIDTTIMEAVSIGKLQLVDLAGSERTRTTGIQNNPKHFKEAIDINKSLFTLNKVISVLSQKNNQLENGIKSCENIYVPYRDSKLTSILKQSLGGNSITIMIACINPIDAFLDETISTLNYATMATNIINDPVKNISPYGKALQYYKVFFIRE